MATKKFNNFVKILLKKRKKIININELKELFKNYDKTLSDTKVYKIIYYLKNRWYLLSIKKDLFYIKKPEENLTSEEIIENNYRKLVKEKIKKDLPTKNRYIWWLNSLELNLLIFNIPENLTIINDIKNSVEKIAKNKTIHFINYHWKEKNYYQIVKPFIQKIKIQNLSFPIAPIEIGLLESLYSPKSEEETYTIELIKKILRKKGKRINYNIIETLIKNWKHHTSINRLYKISKFVNPKIADKLKEIIKKYSFFLDI